MDALCEQGAPIQRERLHSGLSYKRLEEDRFVWPDDATAATLTVEQLHWLLEGIDVGVVRRHPQRAYERAS